MRPVRRGTIAERLSRTSRPSNRLGRSSMGLGPRRTATPSDSPAHAPEAVERWAVLAVPALLAIVGLWALYGAVARIVGAVVHALMAVGS